MAITQVGDAEAAAATVNLPAFNAGDLAIVYAYRNNNATAPTLPAGWTNIDSAGANTNSFRAGYRVLVLGDLTTGVWTNATHIAVNIVRGQSATLPVGGFGHLNGSGANMTTPTVTLIHGDGSSWVIAFAGSKATDANTKTLSSTTDEGSSQGALNVATGRGVASYASRGYSSNVNASGNETFAVEIPISGSYVRATQAYMETVYTPSTVSVRATQVYMEIVYKELAISLTGEGDGSSSGTATLAEGMLATATGSSSATAAMREGLSGTATGSSSGTATLISISANVARVQVVMVG